MAVTSNSGSTYQASQIAPQPDAKTGGKGGLKHRFTVRIISPYQVYYEGDAVSVSAANRTGPFDVLAGHINFFSLLTGGTVAVNTGFQKLEFQIARGIIRVERDQVTLFADV